MTELYVLGNRETGIHFSPFVWRAIMALKHKKIDHEIEILGLEEIGPKISELTGGKWKRVPLLQFDDGTYTYDSFDIALDLEKRYPDAPKLFPNGPSNAKFYEVSCKNQMLPLFKRLVFNMLKIYTKESEVYFRKSREADFGCTLEEFVGDVSSHLDSADAFFDPLRAALKFAPYLEGSQPTYSDYVIYGVLQMVRVVSSKDFDTYVTNHKDDTMKKWCESIDKNLDGCLSNTKTFRDL